MPLEVIYQLVVGLFSGEFQYITTTFSTLFYSIHWLEQGVSGTDTSRELERHWPIQALTITSSYKPMH